MTTANPKKIAALAGQELSPNPSPMAAAMKPPARAGKNKESLKTTSSVAAYSSLSSQRTLPVVGIHEMEPPTRQTSDEIVGVPSHFLSGKALNGLAGVRAAVEEGRHEASCLTGRPCRDLILIKLATQPKRLKRKSPGRGGQGLSGPTGNRAGSKLLSSSRLHAVIWDWFRELRRPSAPALHEHRITQGLDCAGLQGLSYGV